MTVGGTLFSQRRRLRGSHVLQPFGRFLRSPASDVDRYVGLAADLLDKIHKFVGAEGIGVDHAAPCGVERCRPLPGWADSFTPVVLIGKAAARPANVGHLQRTQGGNNVLADSASVRNRGIRANPDALVKAMPEILRELAEDVAVDLRSSLGYVDGQMSSFLGHEWHGRNQKQKRDAKDESNTAEIHDNSQGECRGSTSKNARCTGWQTVSGPGDRFAKTFSETRTIQNRSGREQVK